MIPELEILRANYLPEQAVYAAEHYLSDPDSSAPPSLAIAIPPYLAHQVGSVLVEKLPWNENTRLLLRYFMRLTEGTPLASSPHHEFLVGTIRSLMKKDNTIQPDIAADVVREICERHPSLDNLICYYLKWSSYRDDWTLADLGNEERPFKLAAANLIYQNIVESQSINLELLCSHKGVFAGLAIYQPALIKEWWEISINMRDYGVSSCWTTIIEHSEDYDTFCLDYCDAVSEDRADVALTVMAHLNTKRDQRYLADLLDIVTLPRAALRSDGLKLLLEHREKDVISIMTRAFGESDAENFIGGIDGIEYRKLFALTFERWAQGGEKLLLGILETVNYCTLSNLLRDQLQYLEPVHHGVLQEAIHLALAKLDARPQVDLWRAVADTHPKPFIVEFEAMLHGKSKQLREISASALAGINGKNALIEAHNQLDSKKSDIRLGALALIERIADTSSIQTLRLALENEKSETVRQAIHQALKACGAAEESAALCTSSPEDLDLDTFLTRNAKGLKLPSASWLDIASLPPLVTTDATSLPDIAITYLITKQSKHKEIAATPDILPLLAHIDREKSAPFAAALVDGFLNSEQAAGDRWALTLGGLLGDKRIINLLLPRIQGWCENSRHKLAEYAAQAISLLPGKEPLMVLDTLANRYRTKFKNIGRACSEAFNAAATARGITADELGDMVVPDFGFDADGVRRFDWEGGGISAELGANFKLTWFDPETEKSWKTIPTGAPDEIKVEVKTVTKLIRETVKAQTSRLEMSLVRQRRWPVTRWRELYEEHPLLRSFASGLVWGVYDVSGILLRTFRRYPNGILADAAGLMEELAETDTDIGMVHPLELEQSAISLWRAHLQRMKVKQPFPQLDRPVELMDPLHGNRREISLTKDRNLSAGTFRSRAEKRGWTRGSVVDAGGIASYYKLYPGAGVEVNLPLDGFYIGCDPMEAIELGSACFATAGTIERGSYIYNEPKPDDPRVLRFDQVPPVVFSETISDLKAIIATKE